MKSFQNFKHTLSDGKTASDYGKADTCYVTV
jgi:hypothetical protein